MTVKELKAILAIWPETDPHNGEDAEVWLETGEMLSSMCVDARQLNTCDVLLVSPLWRWPTPGEK